MKWQKPNRNTNCGNRIDARALVMSQIVISATKTFRKDYCVVTGKEIDGSVAPISGSLQRKSNLFLFRTDVVPKFIAKDQQKFPPDAAFPESPRTSTSLWQYGASPATDVVLLFGGQAYDRRLGQEE